MNKLIEDYVEEFMNETSLAMLLDGKHEVREYAKYWIQDIYHFSNQIKNQCIDLHDLELEYNQECKHQYNQSGSILVEQVADLIYGKLKSYKYFGYYYETHHQHLKDVISEMSFTPQSYLDEISISFDQSRGVINELYDVTDVLPLPLTAFSLFSYVNDEFTPDMTEHEGLKRAINEIDKVVLIEYANVNASNFTLSIISILRRFNIRLDKNVEIERISVLNELVLTLRYYLNGIEHQKYVRKWAFSKSYCIKGTIFDLISILKDFLCEVIFVVHGKSKARFSDEQAVYGLYPVKDMAYHGLKLDFPIYLQDKMLDIFEKQSLHIIKESLLLPGKPVVSSSYGVDSVLVQSLVSKVYPSIDTYHGKTGLNYPEVYKVENHLIVQGTMDKNRIYYGKNKVSYWDLVDRYGLNFDRKGNRKENEVGKKISISEMCCQMLKHLPFIEQIKENNWNVNFAGLRADESRARELAAKRDGPIYFANSWNLFRINPIIFWTDDMVWEYTHANQVPYADIYDMTLTNEKGDIVFKPRVGCWSCMLSAKYGYLKWLQKFKPKQYDFLMKEKGLLKLLYSKKLGYDTIFNEFGKEISEEIEGFDPDYVLRFLEQRPCFFDDTIVKL